MALSNVVMGGLWDPWKPLGSGSMACPDTRPLLFWTRWNRLIQMKLTEPVHKRLADRDRARER